MKGKIIKVEDSRVVIKITAEEYGEDRKKCHSCQMKHSCSLPDLTDIEINRNDYDMPFNLNEEVDIEVEPSKVIGISFLVYGLPVILMLLFGCIGHYFSETVSITAGLLGLLCGLGICILVNRYVSSDMVFRIEPYRH